MDKKIYKQIEKDIKLIEKRYELKLRNVKNKQEAKKLYEEKRNEYNEKIYKKYEKNYIDKYINKADETGRNVLIELRRMDMKEKGESNFKIAMYNIKTYTKKMLKSLVNIFTGILMVKSGGEILLNESIEEAKENNYKNYKPQIEIYNKKIESYAEEINKLELNELETLMVVMDDMWKNIKGYGSPDKDLTGYLGLELANQDGVGVCRNMADDVARKLNAINPNFDAVSLGGYADFDDSYLKNDDDNKEGLEFANIEQKILHEDTESEQNENDSESFVNELCKKIVGNHAVVLLKSQQYDAYLIIDPTNPSIGICYNGKIEMINSNNTKGYTLKYTEISDFVLNGLLKYENALKLLQPKISIPYEEIKNSYSVENQNKALEYVRNLKNMSEFERQLTISAHKKNPDISNVEVDRTVISNDISDDLDR